MIDSALCKTYNHTVHKKFESAGAQSPKPLSTGQAAKACGVSQQTMIRAFDRGDIVGFHVPGSKFRKIPMEELRKFARREGLPLIAASEEILVVSGAQEIIQEKLLAIASILESATVIHLTDASFTAGELMAAHHPRKTFIDRELADVASAIEKSLQRSGCPSVGGQGKDYLFEHQGAPKGHIEFCDNTPHLLRRVLEHCQQRFGLTLEYGERIELSGYARTAANS